MAGHIISSQLTKELAVKPANSTTITQKDQQSESLKKKSFFGKRDDFKLISVNKRTFSSSLHPLLDYTKKLKAK